MSDSSSTKMDSQAGVIPLPEYARQLELENTRLREQLAAAHANLDSLQALLEIREHPPGPKEAATAIHDVYGADLDADAFESAYKIAFNPVARYREVRSALGAYERLT